MMMGLWLLDSSRKPLSDTDVARFFMIGRSSLMKMVLLQGSVTSLIGNQLTSRTYMTKTDQTVAAVERLLGEVYDIVSKHIEDLEYRFYFDSGDERYRGEFEMYGEYERFYDFARKDILSLRRKIRKSIPETARRVANEIWHLISYEIDNEIGKYVPIGHADDEAFVQGLQQAKKVIHSLLIPPSDGGGDNGEGEISINKNKS